MGGAGDGGSGKDAAVAGEGGRGATGGAESEISPGDRPGVVVVADEGEGVATGGAVSGSLPVTWEVGPGDGTITAVAAVCAPVHARSGTESSAAEIKSREPAYFTMK
jgi:hypothetical protein